MPIMDAIFFFPSALTFSAYSFQNCDITSGVKVSSGRFFSFISCLYNFFAAFLTAILESENPETETSRLLFSLVIGSFIFISNL